MSAMYLMCLATQYVCSAHVLLTVMTLNLALGSRGCIALVELATNGKKHAEKVALRRYLHNIKLKIMLNVYELLFGIFI